MWAKESDEALVLEGEERGEADRLFTVLARREGKLLLLAKGERKALSKLRRGIDLFYYTRVTFVRTSIRETLTEVDLIKNFSSFHQDWRKFRVADWMGQLANLTLPKGVPEEEIFFLLLNSWKDLEKAEKYYQRFYYYFLWQLLKKLGYQPEISSSSLFFSVQEGGFLTEKEKTNESFLLNPSVHYWLKNILQEEKDKFYQASISAKTEKDLKKISQLYLQSLGWEKDGRGLCFEL
jgi:DNA repair protein RecO